MGKIFEKKSQRQGLPSKLSMKRIRDAVLLDSGSIKEVSIEFWVEWRDGSGGSTATYRLLPESHGGGLTISLQSP